MSVASFDSVKGHNVRNIRKALAGALFAKRYDPADEPLTQVWTTAAGLIVPADYISVGVTAKGSPVQMSRDLQTANVDSWGYMEPTRTDVTSDTDTMQFVMQESNRIAMELFRGADYSGVRPDEDRNLVLDKPSTPTTQYWRAFTLSKDGDGADAIYWINWLPRCSVTSVESQALGEENELQYGVTFTGFHDDGVLTSHRTIWGGPGIDTEAMGFADAAA